MCNWCSTTQRSRHRTQIYIYQGIIWDDVNGRQKSKEHCIFGYLHFHFDKIYFCVRVCINLTFTLRECGVLLLKYISLYIYRIQIRTNMCIDICNKVYVEALVLYVVMLKLTLNDFKLSTTQANSASRPTVTVMLGIGSANRGKFDSAKKKKRINNIFYRKFMVINLIFLAF